MFTYRNTRTGELIYAPCPVSGEWELVEEPKEEAVIAEVAEEPKAEKPKRKRTTKK